MTEAQPTPRVTPLTQSPIPRRGLLGLLGIGLAGTALGVSGCASSSGSSSASPTGSPSPTAAIGNPTVAAVAEMVRTRWPLSEKAWPGMDYAKHDLVLLSTTSDLKVQQAWLINTTSARELSKDEYASITVPPTFDKLDFQGRAAAVLSMQTLLSTLKEGLVDKPAGPERDAENLFRVGTHELVHFYHQDSAVASAGASRDTAYPVDSKPRLLRRMLLHRLHQASKDKDGRAALLGKAAYWEQQWRSQYPQEAEGIRVYDIREGTADYFENYLANIDPKAADQTDSLSAGLKDSKYYSAADSESYALGFVTGLLLDQQKPGWQESFYASGKTLVQVLLDGVAPVKDSEEPEIRAGVEKVVKETNDQAAPAIQAVDKALADPQVAYLTYTGNLAQVAYEGSYKYQGKVVLQNPELEFNAKGGRFTVRLPAVFAPDGKNYHVPLPKGSHSYSDGKLTVTGDQVSGSAPAKLSKENGRQIYTIDLA